VTARIEKAVLSGVFSLDGQDFDVDNNVWLVGDDDEVLVIDAPHDAAPIVEAIDGRRVTAIVLTHGHNDHINAAVDLREATGAPIWFNPADLMLWKDVHPSALPDRPSVTAPASTSRGPNWSRCTLQVTAPEALLCTRAG
jgi:glyoxylase-like metal-dependent hydrolase (beta-lactamase superfamily II)